MNKLFYISLIVFLSIGFLYAQNKKSNTASGKKPTKTAAELKNKNNNQNTEESEENETDEEKMKKLLEERETVDYKDDPVFRRRNDSAVNAIRKKWRTFAVYTYKDVKNKNRLQLCINLVNKDTNYRYCVNDSICKDPEKYKILYQKKIADTSYYVIYVFAFSKNPSKPGCAGGKEIKLYFVKWNEKFNTAKFKPITIHSCYKGIENMTKENIEEWSGQTPLKLSIYRGGSDFRDYTFDPQFPQKGFQGESDTSKE
jgi:hypothetical protein